MDIIFAVLSIVILDYHYELKDKVIFPYEESKFTKDTSSSTLYEEATLHIRYHHIVQGKEYYDLDNNDFYWFLNNDNELEIYFFSNNELKLIRRLKYEKGFKLTKIKYPNRIDLKLKMENNKYNIEYSYIESLNKIVSF